MSIILQNAFVGYFTILFVEQFFFIESYLKTELSVNYMEEAEKLANLKIFVLDNRKK